MLTDTLVADDVAVSLAPFAELESDKLPLSVELVAEFTLLDSELLDSELLELLVVLSALKWYVIVGLLSVSVVIAALSKV